MSAETLAERIGVSKSTITRYEKGEIAKIPSARLPLIADAIGLRLAELLPCLDEETGEWATAWNAASPEARQAALAVLRLTKQAGGSPPDSEP